MRAALTVGAAFLLATAAGFAADPPRAPTTLAECDAKVRTAPADLSSYRCYWFVGRNQACLQEASRRLGAIVAADPRNLQARLILGILAADLGQERSEPLLSETIDQASARDEAEVEILARLTLARLMRFGGRSARAASEVETALERAEEFGNPELLARVTVDLGWQKYYQREYGAAWRIFKRAESLVFPEGHIQERLETLDGLAAVSWALGRGTDAIEYYRREADLTGGRDPFRRSNILRNMALVAEGLVGEGRYPPDEFMRLCREALDAAVRAGSTQAELGARLMLARTLRGEEGIEEVRRSLALARSLGRLGDTCWALGALGTKLLERGPAEEQAAFRSVEEAIALAREHADAENLAHGLLTRAGMRRRAGPRERAVEDSLAALAAVERIRDLQPDGEARARVFGRFAGSYRRAAGFVLASAGGSAGPEDLEAAFAIMERMRARSLLDALDSAGATAAVAAAGPLADERSKLLAEIATRGAQLADPDLNTESRRRVLAELDRLETRQDAVREKISRADPDFAALRGLSVPSLAEIREALGENQALLSFQIGAAEPGASPEQAPCWAIVVWRRGASAIPLPGSDGVEAKSRLYLSLLARRDGAERNGGEQLYRDLLERPLAALGEEVTRLVVAPDGALHRVPWGALLVPGTGKALAERYEVVVVPSATTWLRFRRGGSPEAGAAVLSLADPDPARGDATGLPFGGPDLGPLPFARWEASALQRSLGAEGSLLLGKGATEAALKRSDLSRFGIIHLAAHAITYDEDPGRSAVVLARGDGGDDGLLSFSEVLDLDLDGQVVILSACRSGSGPVVGGEGVMGLANAFFQAGARCVVAGLWPVRDRETAALVQALGMHLAKGRSIASALAEASREAIGRRAPPAAWAGIVVLGDGDLVPLPAGRGRLPAWPWLAGAGVLLGFILLGASRSLARPRARRAS